MLDSIRQLVLHETPTHDKAQLDALAELLANRMESAGARAEVLPIAAAGNHVRAHWGDENGVKPGLLLCHFDTVWPMGTIDRLPFRVENNCAHGPGILDMKSSLVLVEYALRLLSKKAGDSAESGLVPPRPITVLMTSDEEVGSYHSREVIEEEAKKAAYVLVMEPPLPGGVLKTARKGIGRFQLQIAGKAAHAGVDPDKGASAVLELAQQILHLNSLADREKETTLNVGVIRGGTAANVIAAEAGAQIDVRVWSEEEAQRISQAFTQLQPSVAGCTVRMTGAWNRPPMERKVTLPLFERVRAVGAKLGMDLQEAGTGGGSDGNFTAALGIPTMDGLGVPGAGAHADQEHILIDQLPSRLALLTALLCEL